MSRKQTCRNGSSSEQARANSPLASLPMAPDSGSEPRCQNQEVVEPRGFRSVLCACRVHPVGCALCVVSYMLAVGITVYAVVSFVRGGGLTSDWWLLLCGVLFVWPPAWIKYVWRKGPFSRVRRERYGYWVLVRKISFAFAVVLLSLSVLMLAGVAVLSYLIGPLPRELDSTRGLVTPLGFLAAGLLALWGWNFARKRAWILEGKCARCGYLLRGLTEARCPECGTPFNASDPEQGAVPPDGPVDRSAS